MVEKRRSTNLLRRVPEASRFLAGHAGSLGLLRTSTSQSWQSRIKVHTCFACPSETCVRNARRKKCEGLTPCTARRWSYEPTNQGQARMVQNCTKSQAKSSASPSAPRAHVDAHPARQSAPLYSVHATRLYLSRSQLSTHPACPTHPRFDPFPFCFEFTGAQHELEEDDQLDFATGDDRYWISSTLHPPTLLPME